MIRRCTLFLRMLESDSTATPRVNTAVKTGVQIVACENTMEAMKLTRADMNTSVGFVPGGVIEIMERQKEGWANVRP